MCLIRASPCPALLLRFFYTTCRGTEVAMSSSCVKNVDSVSEPKSKINKANYMQVFLCFVLFFLTWPFEASVY